MDMQVLIFWFGKLKNDSKQNIFSEENNDLIRKYNRFSIFQKLL